MIKVTPATPRHLLSFYGEPLQRTATAVAALRGDEVVAVAGAYTDHARRVVFMDVAPGERPLGFEARRALLTGWGVLARMLAGGAPVQAQAQNDICGSGALLKHLGFTDTGGGLHTWHG